MIGQLLILTEWFFYNYNTFVYIIINEKKFFIPFTFFSAQVLALYICMFHLRGHTNTFDVN